MKYIKLLILLFLVILDFDKSFAVESLINQLKDGGKIVFIRHSNAPGSGDPNNFSIKDCSTQRNLDYKGIQEVLAQSTKHFGFCLQLQLISYKKKFRFYI